MSFINYRHDDTALPQDPHGVPESIEDQFDFLLEHSSLGTPNARAIRAMTSDDLVDTVHDRVEARARDVGLEVGDIDDVLLDVVRKCAAAPPWHKPDPGTSLAGRDEYIDLVSRPIPALFVSAIDAGKSEWWVWSMLAHLAASNVFEHVRRDVARSIVDICFRTTRHGCADLLVLIADSAMIRSGIVDEVTDEIHWHLPSISPPLIESTPTWDASTDGRGDAHFKHEDERTKSATFAIVTEGDHPAPLKDLQSHLHGIEDMELAGVFSSVSAMVESPVGATVVMLDISLLGEQGVGDNVLRIRARGAQVVLYGDSESRPEILREAVDFGALGLVLKSDPEERIAEAVRAAAAGDHFVSSQLAYCMITDLRANVRLTARERDMLTLLAKGLPHRLIAKQLGISETTLPTYLTRARQRYSDARTPAADNGELITSALEGGYIERPLGRKREPAPDQDIMVIIVTKCISAMDPGCKSEGEVLGDPNADPHSHELTRTAETEIFPRRPTDTYVAQIMLGLLNERPMSFAVLVSALRQWTADKNVGVRHVRQELRTLYSDGLVTSVSNLRMGQRTVRYRLTSFGQLRVKEIYVTEPSLRSHMFRILTTSRCRDSELSRILPVLNGSVRYRRAKKR